MYTDHSQEIVVVVPETEAALVVARRVPPRNARCSNSSSRNGRHLRLPLARQPLPLPPPQAVQSMLMNPPPAPPPIVARRLAIVTAVAIRMLVTIISLILTVVPVILVILTRPMVTVVTICWRRPSADRRFKPTRRSHPKSILLLHPRQAPQIQLLPILRLS